jgi:peptidyl-prolyl cis-trans isomerase B (cyclophilin B)
VKKWIVLAVVVLVMMTGGMYLLSKGDSSIGGSPDASPGSQKITGTQTVTIQTDKGEVVIEVYPDLLQVTAGNFINLVQKGFYNGLVFHRVEDWVVQTGDPTGTGTGGSGQTIPLETHPELTNVRGAVGMARSADPDSASSQFYILTKDAPSLDGQYAIFGRVVEGMDVIDQIQQGDTMAKVEMK